MSAMLISISHMSSLYLLSYLTDSETKYVLPSVDLLISKAALEKKEMIYMKYFWKVNSY